MGFQKLIQVVSKYIIATMIIIAFGGMFQYWVHEKKYHVIPYSCFNSKDIPSKLTIANCGIAKIDERGMEDISDPNILQQLGPVTTTKKEQTPSKGDTENSTIKKFNDENIPHVIFHVLPKSGSRTLFSVALNTAVEHGMAVQHTMGLVNETVLEKIQRLVNYDAPHFIYTHFPFVQIQSSKRRIVYISVVRDPIERLVSLYYYKRFGDSTSPGTFLAKMGKMNLSRDTFNECVEKRKQACVKNLDKTIRHFCGINETQYYTQEGCFENAMENVKKKHLVVGVMDDYMGFVRLLERLLPDILTGASSFYERFTQESYFSVMKTKNKTGPSEEVHKFLRSKMHQEYQLYHFVKEEFDSMKSKFGIDSTRART